MKARKFNRYEKKEIRDRKLRNDMAGSGIHVYQNNTNSDLSLPKPTASGQKKVGPREQFQGDSYYQMWVGPPMNLLRFVSTISSAPLPVPEGPGERIRTLDEAKDMAEKEKQLFLDQPDAVTDQGAIEHRKAPVQHKAEDTKHPAHDTEVLLTEDPLDGVEIILG